jgi:hypothetical protein
MKSWIQLSDPGASPGRSTKAAVCGSIPNGRPERVRETAALMGLNRFRRRLVETMDNPRCRGQRNQDTKIEMPSRKLTFWDS